jgi:hypothetical protein
MDRIRDRLLEFLEWLRQEVTKLFTILRLKTDATSLQRERGALYQELGKKAADLMKEERLNTEELRPTVERIEALTARIEERRAAVEALLRSRHEPAKPSGQN